MFLNGLKIKSIFRKLEKVNQERVPITEGNELKAICILEQADKPFDRTKLAALGQIFQLKEEAFMIKTFVKQKKKTDKENTTLFSPKDIGWKGVFKNPALKELKHTPFDLLISYYRSDNMVLHTVSSLVPAHFKVGLGADIYQAHDLCLEVSEEQTDVFLAELKKYFKILKIT